MEYKVQITDEAGTLLGVIRITANPSYMKVGFSRTTPDYSTKEKKKNERG